MAAASTALPQPRVTRGILLRIASATSFAVMAALLKLAAARGASLVELYFYRSFFGLPVVLLWVSATDGLGALVPNRPVAHVWRSLLGMASMFFTFEALILLPLAEATTINFTGPIFATLLSWLLLSEKVGRRRWTAALAAFLGVVVVMRPGAAHEAISLVGIGFGLLAAMGQASVTVTLRHLGDREHVAAIVFWFLLACSVVGLVLLPFFGTRPDAGTIAILVATGVVGGLAQIFMTGSLQVAPIGTLAPFDYLQLIVALLLGWILFGTGPTFNTLAGAALITGSGLYTVWRVQQRARERALAATVLLD
jgi:drug/metabolite transporter (DMT)-like permease